MPPPGQRGRQLAGEEAEGLRQDHRRVETQVRGARAGGGSQSA